MEIQDFAQDFANEGFGWEKGDSKGFPSKFVTIEQLVSVYKSTQFQQQLNKFKGI